MNAVEEIKQPAGPQSQPATVAKGKPAVSPLSDGERARFVKCEEIIHHHFATYRDAGSALAEIRDKRYYRGSHPTFETYCRLKWDMSRTQANRLIAAAKSVEGLVKQDDPQLTAVAEQLPEASIRPLTLLKPKEQARALKKAMKKAPGGVTARVIAEAAREVNPGAFRRAVTPTATPSGRGSDGHGDLIRRSELLEEIGKWEKAQKAVGKFEALKPGAVLKEVRRIIGQLD